MEIQAFFNAMSTLATTVTVVTTNGPAGMGGVTVSAMTSVTAEPPSLLACIHEMSKCHELIGINKKFCVNVLRQNQVHLSQLFSEGSQQDQAIELDRDDWSVDKLDIPVLNKALASFECRLTDQYKIGSHTIFIGEVVICTTSHGIPLIYVNRSYLN